jgi:hypothetical protein
VYGLKSAAKEKGRWGYFYFGKRREWHGRRIRERRRKV